MKKILFMVLASIGVLNAMEKEETPIWESLTKETKAMILYYVPRVESYSQIAQYREEDHYFNKLMRDSVVMNAFAQKLYDNNPDVAQKVFKKAIKKNKKTLAEALLKAGVKKNG